MTEPLTETTISVMVVDDNPIVRAAIRGYLDGTDDARVIAEAADGKEALATARRLHPTVTLLDYRMPITDGLAVVADLRSYTLVLVLTADADPQLIASMLRNGASGYLVHGEFDPPELLCAVRAVAAGNGWLSPVAAAVAAATLREQLAREQSQVAEAERLRHIRRSYGLTQREQEILALLSEGLSNAAIARRLALTEKTVKNHLNHMFAKLQVTNRTQATFRWSGHSS